MSFTTEPKPGPTIAQPTGAKSTSQQSARERAVAILTQPAAPAPTTAQEHPVRNPTQISAEELSAVKSRSSEQSSESTEQKDTTDSPQTTVTETKKAENPLSPHYALLARKEKALRVKAQELKAREDSFRAKEEAVKSKEAEYQSKYIPKDRFTNDTLAALSEVGITYDQLTSLILNQPKPEDAAQNAAFHKLEAEIKALRDAQEASKKSYEDSQTNAYNQAVTQIRNETKQLVNSDPSFEVIKATNSVNDVVELIERTFKDDGVLLSVEEAAKEVEEYLMEEAYKLANLKKVQSKFKPATPTQTQAPKQQETTKQPQPMKTLTNSASATRPLTARERAIAAFKGQLK